MLLDRDAISHADRILWRVTWLLLAIPFLGLSALLVFGVVDGDGHPGILAIVAFLLAIAGFLLWKAAQEPSKPIVPRGGQGWLEFLIGAVVEVGILIGISAAAAYLWPF